MLGSVHSYKYAHDSKSHRHHINALPFEPNSGKRQDQTGKMSDHLVMKDLKKLCILNAKETDSDDKIRQLCEQFGRLVHFNRPLNKKQLAFPLYQTESDAQHAKDGLIEKGYRVEFANAKSRTDNSSEDASFEFRPKTMANASSNGCVEADSTCAVQRPFGACIKCGGKAYYNCGRCGDFYCSEECQSDDWLQHKRICFPMPKLMPAKSTHSLYLSRGNISDSKENLKAAETGNALKNIDSADGRENIRSPSLHSNNAATIASHQPMPSNSTGASPVAEIPKVKVEEKRSSSEKVVSPRQRLLSLVSNGESEPAQTSEPAQPTEPAPAQPSEPAPAQATNGMVMDSIANDSEVYITYVKSTRIVYIRSATTNDEYTKLITEVDEASKTAPKLADFPTKSDLIMAPFDGMYNRAMVVNTDKQAGTIKVGFVDFGNAEDVLFSQCKVLPTELQQHRRLVFPVSLQGIKEDAEPNEINTMKLHLEELCNSIKGLKLKGDKPEISAKDQVELFDLITNEPISSALNKMTVKRYRIEDLDRKITKGTDLELMIIDTQNIDDNIIACIVKSDVDKLMQCDTVVQKYGDSVKTAPAYKPKVKELCLAKIKDVDGDAWYRCQYQQELVGNKAQLFCFDYGKTCNARENNIRRFDNELAFEIVSFIARFKENDSETKRKVRENSEIFAKTIEYDGDVHIITLA